MPKEIKSISNPQLSINILSEEDIKAIHDKTLEIIDTVGVRFPSTRALDLWEENGAIVDRESQVIKVSGDIIGTALNNAPSSYTLAARNSSQDLPLDGNHVYLGTDGCGVEVIDLNTGERRRSTLNDVANIALVADFVDEIGFHWVAVSAQDYPPESRGLHEIRAIWENSTKHVQTESVYSIAEAQAAVEMAAIIAGGKNELRKRPPLSIMQCTTSPLGHDGGSLDAALTVAEAGIPVGFMTMASCLTTGPATLAGTIAVGNAEVLSALALIQLAYPGTPVFYAAAQTASDPRTGVYTGGGPEDFLFGAATNILSDFYEIPLSMGAFATGAKEPNWQAGIDNSFSAFMASIVMSDMLLGVGLLHGSRIWSFEQMLMDCEIFDLIRKIMKGIVVDDEYFAMEAIKSVGPGGNYLAQKHSLKHMHELWLPKYMDRRPYSVWEKNQYGAREWAKQEAISILEEHQPDPLDSTLSNELTKIIASVENEK